MTLLTKIYAAVGGICILTYAAFAISGVELGKNKLSDSPRTYSSSSGRSSGGGWFYGGGGFGGGK